MLALLAFEEARFGFIRCACLDTPEVSFFMPALLAFHVNQRLGFYFLDNVDFFLSITFFTDGGRNVLSGVATATTNNLFSFIELGTQ